MSESNYKSNVGRDFNVADDVLAKQFYSLPSQNRNDINEEIHGVRSMACEETPDLLDYSLRQLSSELQNLPLHYRTIYHRASNPMINIPATRSNDNDNQSVDNLVKNVDAETGDRMDVEFFSEQEIPPASSNTASCYVKSENFQLAFLRCELFDAKKAAMRMTKYLELVYDLYGEEALRRPLRLDDLKSKEEIDVLKAGFQQLLPFRDRSGRRVLFVHGDFTLPSSSLMSRSVLHKGPAMKVLLYLWSVLIEDVEAQRQGLVIIFWPRYGNSTRTETFSQEDAKPSPVRKGAKKKKGGSRKERKPNQSTDYGSNEFPTVVPDTNSRSTGMGFFEAVPVRFCAFHFCMPDLPFFQMVRHVMLLIVGENFRTRIKTHQGVGMEVRYSLMGYGIPVDTIPFDEVTLTLKTKICASFIKVRRTIEAEQSNLYNRNPSSGAVTEFNSSHASVSSGGSNRSSMIECPSLYDVIFRSGKSYMSHPGNMMFRELIEHHINEHNKASQDRKKNLTWQVIEEVETKGGRFLEFNRSLGTWTELTDRAAVRHKIATYFKEFRRKMKAQQQIQMNPSSTHDFEAQDGRKRKKQKQRTGYLPENCFSNL